MRITTQRIGNDPIIGPGLHPSIGDNIQGPSLIRMPDWAPGRLGRYHLYFADHKGAHIRLAFADAVEGPWTIHPPGALHLRDSRFLTAPPVPTAAEMRRFEAHYAGRGAISHDVLSEITAPHIASPDVHVDHVNRRIIMYFHGLEGVGHQVSRAATSPDGLNFTVRPEVIGKSYMRIFPHAGMTYALTMPGTLSRSIDGLTGFTPGPTLFNPNMRHAAVMQRNGALLVFWTQVGDVPERILLSRIALAGDWMAWRETPPIEILRPEHDWEGANAPLLPSVRSTAHGRVNQLRDPAIFEEDGAIWLLYAVGGESGIALARIEIEG